VVPLDGVWLQKGKAPKSNKLLDVQVSTSKGPREDKYSRSAFTAGKLDVEYLQDLKDMQGMGNEVCQKRKPFFTSVEVPHIPP